MATIVAFVAVVFGREPQRRPDTFSITGYVLDADGHLVLGAEVHARPSDRGGLESQSLTNLGRFNLSVNGPGRYLVYCFKDNRGYREIDEALVRLDPEGIPTVVVTDQSPKAVTVIRLRPRAAKLTVRLIDSETGRPLEKVQLKLRREHSPNDQFIKPLTAFHKNATIKLLLPSFPLRLSVSAAGYENWSYSDPSSEAPSARLLLAPDEAREITVALRPLRKPQ